MASLFSKAIRSLAALDANGRFLSSLVVSVVFFLGISRKAGMGESMILSWNAFAAAYLILAWIRIFTTPPQMVPDVARLQHLRRQILFVFVLLAACSSLWAVFSLLNAFPEFPKIAAGSRAAIAFATLILSWGLIHTMFTFHYAYLYYCRGFEKGHSVPALVFPEGGNDPDYKDFAYFSFVIGMTSQVSDVQIGCRQIRAWSLLHGLVSFGFNTAVLALAVNAVSGIL